MGRKTSSEFARGGSSSENGTASAAAVLEEQQQHPNGNGSGMEKEKNYNLRLDDEHDATILTMQEAILETSHNTSQKKTKLLTPPVWDRSSSSSGSSDGIVVLPNKEDTADMTMIEEDNSNSTSNNNDNAAAAPSLLGLFQIAIAVYGCLLLGPTIWNAINTEDEFLHKLQQYISKFVFILMRQICTNMDCPHFYNQYVEPVQQYICRDDVFWSEFLPVWLCPAQPDAPPPRPILSPEIRHDSWKPDVQIVLAVSLCWTLIRLCIWELFLPNNNHINNGDNKARIYADEQEEYHDDMVQIEEFQEWMTYDDTNDQHQQAFPPLVFDVKNNNDDDDEDHGHTKGAAATREDSFALSDADESSLEVKSSLSTLSSSGGMQTRRNKYQEYLNRQQQEDEAQRQQPSPPPPPPILTPSPPEDDYYSTDGSTSTVSTARDFLRRRRNRRSNIMTSNQSVHSSMSHQARRWHLSQKHRRLFHSNNSHHNKRIPLKIETTVSEHTGESGAKTTGTPATTPVTTNNKTAAAAAAATSLSSTPLSSPARVGATARFPNAVMGDAESVRTATSMTSQNSVRSCTSMARGRTSVVAPQRRTFPEVRSRSATTTRRTPTTTISASGYFRLLYALLAIIQAFLYFSHANFWPPYYLGAGHSGGQQHLDESPSYIEALFADDSSSSTSNRNVVDPQQATIKQYLLGQASYHLHSLTFPIFMALFFRRRQQSNTASSGSAAIGSSSGGSSSNYWLSIVLRHVSVLWAIAVAYMVLDLRKLMVIGLFAYDVSSGCLLLRRLFAKLTNNHRIVARFWQACSAFGLLARMGIWLRLWYAFCFENVDWWIRLEEELSRSPVVVHAATAALVVRMMGHVWITMLILSSACSVWFVLFRPLIPKV